MDIAPGFVLVTHGSAAAFLAACYWTASGVSLLSLGLLAVVVISHPQLGRNIDALREHRCVDDL